MPDTKKRYAQVGLGGRSWMYTQALIDTYAEHSELVGLCDVNQGRMDLANRRAATHREERGLPALPPAPTYRADGFDRMIAEARPDVVIVTTGPDVTHSEYIVRAMRLGCDVITEKPMTTDEIRCREILQTVADTGRSCRVTFNYRYSPPRSQIREMLAGGAIGPVRSVDFCWMLDTRHGADYFRRWHRLRGNAGSLLVHKATHHFDLVNWWIGDVPEEVFAHGAKHYYRPETADAMGLAGRSDRCHTCRHKADCRFALDMAANERMTELYLDHEHEDGYFRDRCVFSDEIDIWDTMSLSVRYNGGALMNYALHAYSPYEGYKIAFNGDAGRLEHTCCETTYINGDGTVPGELEKGNVSTTLIPAFRKPRAIDVWEAQGGHGGGDEPLLEDVLSPEPPQDPLARRADQRDGAYSILVGIAAYHSIDRGRPVRISDLLGDAPI